MHPLFGPLKKARRAKERLNSLEAEIGEAVKADNYRLVIAELDRETGQHALRLDLIDKTIPPLRWSLDIGEIAFNLRSALDHIAVQLALSQPRGGKVTFALYEQTQFPIRLRSPSSKFSKWRWDDNMRSIAHLCDDHRTILQGMQPYSRRNRERPFFGPFRGRVPVGRRHPLWLLAELNNADKHRLLVLTAMELKSTGMTLTRSPNEFEIERFHLHRPPIKLVNGAKVGSIGFRGDPTDVEMEFRVRPEVIFWRGCRAVKGLPVVITLERLHHEVDHLISRLAAQFPPMNEPWGPPP